LNSQLDEIRAEASKVDQMQVTIQELRRQKELEEANYRYYEASLEQSRINEALGTGKVSNISQIQTPSPPALDLSKTPKMVAGIAVSGFALGLAWAFLIELYLDRTVRRPIDIERILGVPLFLSIPDMRTRSFRRRMKSIAKEQQKSGAPAEASTALATSDPLHPFHETLRDRLISYFESRNLTHKPKLVAVTGFNNSAGVTTTAAGLASTLSETGDGNVLLVDLTLGQGSAQHFYKGRTFCGLEEILTTRNSAQIQDKLYVVAQEPGTERVSRILPQRFSKLVPKLKASDFDYIIFDMPPVSQISVTPRLAGFMDMVLLVVESETTDRDLVRRAATLLSESKAHVGVVLNKTTNYVPTGLHQEYLGNA
jgi:Mrp family chromosome partitioning ATPase